MLNLRLMTWDVVTCELEGCVVTCELEGAVEG